MYYIYYIKYLSARAYSKIRLTVSGFQLAILASSMLCLSRLAWQMPHLYYSEQDALLHLLHGTFFTSWQQC